MLKLREKPFYLYLGIILVFISAEIILFYSYRQDKGLVNINEALNIEKVDTEEARKKGLSGREAIADNQGMLFVFDYPSRQCIWMKDMKFDLDIAWLDKNKKVIKLMKDVKPDTYPESFCSEDTNYVLETNSGVMNHLGIQVGDSAQL